MQIKLSVAVLALIPLLASALPASAPVTSVPFAKKRSFRKANGAVDIPALTAHVDEVRA